MKIIIVNSDGEQLGEVKLSQQLLRRPEILSERIERTIESALRAKVDAPELDRIVENLGGTLESLDEDASIMDVPLKLSDACKFDFGKHVDAIAEAEQTARQEHTKYTKLNENVREYDARYKERPGNRIRFK